MAQEADTGTIFMDYLLTAKKTYANDFKNHLSSFFLSVFEPFGGFPLSTFFYNITQWHCLSADPNTSSLDPDPGFWPNLDPDTIRNRIHNTGYRYLCHHLVVVVQCYVDPLLLPHAEQLLPQPLYLLIVLLQHRLLAQLLVHLRPVRDVLK